MTNMRIRVAPQSAGREDLLFWGIVLFVAAIAAAAPSLSMHHVFASYDLSFHLARIEGMKEALLAGQFPVRINPVQLGGYGMPTEIFYPDLFLYPVALLRMAGLSVAACWNVFLIGNSLLTAFLGWWGFTLYTRSPRMGAIASLFYLTALYRVMLTYISAAAGTIVAMAFFPLALAAVWMTLRRDASHWPLVVLGVTGILQSHVLSAIFIVAAALLMAAASLPRFREADVRRAAGKAVFWTALLNLWYMAPFLYFQTHMDFLLKAVTQQDVRYEMIYPIRQGECYIGSVMALMLIGLGIQMVRRRREQERAREFWGLLILSAVVIVAVSRPHLWHLLGTAAGFLQFPGRLTVFPAVFVALAAAIGLAHARKGLVIVLAAACLCGNLAWLHGASLVLTPQENAHRMLRTQRVTAENYLARHDIAYDGYRDYMDIRTAALFSDDAQLRQKFEDRELRPAGRIESVQRTGTSFDVRYAAGAAGELQFPIFWYAGYTAQDAEGRELPVRRDEMGQVSVTLPAAGGELHLHYAGLPWFHWVDGLSALAWMAFLFLCYRGYRNQNHRRSFW